MIDRNRGCTIRFHRAGMRVVMYHDSPGEYFDEKGKPLTDEIAKSAGYDVASLKKEREKQDKMKAFRAKLDAEYAAKEDAIAREMGESLYKVKHVGGGQYAILSADGERITQHALSRDEAEKLLTELENGKETPQETETKG